MITIQKLHENWTAQAAGDLPSDMPAGIRQQLITAAVPGCIHTDLLAAGLIDDPYLDRNELVLQWIGLADWQYRTSFEVEASLLSRQRVELVCEGLDTIAAITLNGHHVGETADMHVAYRFDVTSLLKTGANELTITFLSAQRYAEAKRDEMGDLPRPAAYGHPFNFIRKMACNFGWDWGPVFITAGIWQPIYLCGWDTARFDSVRPLVAQADPNSATLDVLVDLDRAAPGPLKVTATLTAPDGRVLAQEAAAADEAVSTGLAITVEKPQLWWPRGYGEQPLYDLTVTLHDQDDTQLDRWEGRVGLRSVRHNTTPDEIGSQFTIEVNGQPIFCKGANWIPDDCFPTRVDERRYRQRIEQAAAANMNMLRIWGGGIYENKTFYDICDEMGVMVWQDFLFACAAYPEEPPYPALVEAEARYQVTRLSRHPSLVIWNGNNENIWGYFDWNWQPRLEGRTWGLGYYLDLLPRIVGERDPSRPYWPASPYSGSMDIPPNYDEHGNTHIWSVWHGGNYHIYRHHNPRFCSEFGFQAPPTYATLQRALPPEQLAPGSAGLAHRQKSPGGDDKNAQFLADYFETPTDFDDWLYLMQINQARALQTGIEWFRSRQPVCMGTLYWQINDCWPVTSWACIDGDGRPKPLWYATKRFYADRLLTFQPESAKKGSGLELFANNDTGQAWRGTIILQRLTFIGEVLASDSITIEVPARTNTRATVLSADLATPGDASRELLVAQMDGVQAIWFFDIDKNLDYPEPAFRATLNGSGDTYQLILTAEHLLRDAAIFVDRIDPAATISDQLVTLLPGQSVTFTIESAQPLDVESLTKPPVFQSVNRFGRKGSR